MKICNLSLDWELHTPGVVRHARQPVVLDPAIAGHHARDWLQAVERWLATKAPNPEGSAWVSARLARNVWKGLCRESAGQDAGDRPLSQGLSRPWDTKALRA